MFNFFKKSKKEQNENQPQSIVDSENTPQVSSINTLQELQKEYKKKNENWFLEIKNNPKLITVPENFFKESDLLWIIFTIDSYYHLFEYLLSKDYNIAKGVLWSSNIALDSMKNNTNPFIFGNSQKINKLKKFYGEQNAGQIKNDVNSFISGDFAKLKKLLKKIAVYENENDYTFVLLKLLQVGAASYFSQIFVAHYKIDFGNIDATSLEECSFIYFSQGDIFDEPKISFFTYHMIDNSKFGEVENIDYYNFLNRKKEIAQLLNDKKEDFEYRLFETSMTKKALKIKSRYSIQDIDLMSGADFEQFVAKMFTKMGYVTSVTKHSGDYGVDVIAERDGIKIGIQAKCYSGSVSNSAIQEIVAGMKYYSCHKGVVVTNSKFTNAAIELAKANNIKLWDRKILEEKLLDVFHEE